MHRKLLMVGLVVVCAGRAFASFDLFLVPGNDQRYHRFDPVNQVNLGQYNSILGSSTPGNMGVSANNSSQWGLMRAVQGTHAVKIGTGDLGPQQALATQLYLNDTADRWAAISGGALRIYSFDANLGTSGANQLSGTTLASMSVLRIAPFADGRWFVAGLGTSGTLSGAIISSTGTVLNAGTALVAAGAFSSSANFGQPCVLANGKVVMPYMLNTGVSSYIEVTTTGDVFNTPTGPFSLLGIASTITTATVAAVRSHEGFYLVGAGATAGTSFVRSYGASGTITNSYTTTAFVAPTDGFFSMSNIVAPEPASMTALGLGLAAIMRSRRKS